jgi:hypothetical protein
MKKQNKYVKISRKISNDGKQWWEHRWVWTQANGDIPKGMHIHHINGIKYDNRIENLALTTCQENNQKKIGKGWVKLGKRYMSQRVINGKRNYLGMYGTMCGAYMASRMAYV